MNNKCPLHRAPGWCVLCQSSRRMSIGCAACDDGVRQRGGRCRAALTRVKIDAASGESSAAFGNGLMAEAVLQRHLFPCENVGPVARGVEPSQCLTCSELVRHRACPLERLRLVATNTRTSRLWSLPTCSNVETCAHASIWVSRACALAACNSGWSVAPRSSVRRLTRE